MSAAELLDRLLPRPRRAAAPAAEWRPATELSLHVAAPDDDAVVGTAVERLESAFAAHRHPLRRTDSATGAEVRLAVAATATRAENAAESYRLTVAADGVELTAAGAAGLLHGASTLVQWLRLAARRGGRIFPLPALEVVDRPDFAHRGVLLDVARDKVPAMAELRRRIDLLSGLKINQLQLYIEHTFAYRGHETVWRGASPLTPDEVRELDAFCRARAIELVPNQNSFGHLHRWLVHDAYRPLAECPEGVDHPWSHPLSPRPEPFSLCAVDPRSLDLLADLYGQLLPCFTSASFNVGLDESFDLGRCRSREACEASGRHRVYVDFLAAVHALAAAHGRSIQYWGDVVLEEPAVVPDLPADATALLWGYEAGHPFAEHARRFADPGLPFFVCPGTSSWSSLTGRTTNALDNVAEAAAAGRDEGAGGLLVTDWGDFGNLTPWPFSEPGLVAGAAAAWNAGRPVGRGELGPLLDTHLLGDRAGGAGAALADLGDVYLVSGGGNDNGTALFRMLLKPAWTMGEERLAGLTRDRLAATAEHVERSSAAFAAAAPRLVRPDAAQVAAEVAWAAAAVRFACDLGRARLALDSPRSAPLAAVPAARRKELGRRLDALLERRRELWLLRNRPGGLDHAFGFLAPLRRSLHEA
jgi:hexosaminidase